MARKKKDRMKAITNDVIGYTGAGVTMGLGAGIAGGAIAAAGPAGALAAPAMAGFPTMAGFMPIMATTMMGGHALGALRDMNSSMYGKKKRKKRR